jgi:2-keto-3-deoxy-6-phosphogluconate aldolase
MLKALAGPFRDVVFCPTGGITLQTAPQFLALPNVKVVRRLLVDAGRSGGVRDWSRITHWPARPPRFAEAPAAALQVSRSMSSIL